jgi:hypothetical protein
MTDRDPLERLIGIVGMRTLSRNHCSLGSSTPFSTASVKLRKTRYEQMFSDLHQITDIPPQQKKQWASAP